MTVPAVVKVLLSQPLVSLDVVDRCRIYDSLQRIKPTHDGN